MIEWQRCRLIALCVLFASVLGVGSVVDLLGAICHIGLLDERSLPWVLQVNQCADGGSALGLGFECQRHVSFSVLKVFLMCRAFG